MYSFSFCVLLGLSSMSLAQFAISPPVIDLSSLDVLSITMWTDEVAILYVSLLDALANHGVFIGVNHPVPIDLLQSSLKSSSQLFSLPNGIKSDLQFNSSLHFGRGYLSFGSESGLKSIFELKEGYSYGDPVNTTPNPTSWLRNPNIWPYDYTNSQIAPFNDLYRQFSDISELLVMLLIQGRQREGKHTQIMVAGGAEISIMRLFHYFPATTVSSDGNFETGQKSQKWQKDVLGSSPHTDWGLLTIILQTGQGLQYRKNGGWVDVPYIPNSLIFNAGDYFSLATGHDFHSPVHRVLCPVSEERTSFVFFFYPHYSSPVTRLHKHRHIEDDDLDYNTLTVLDYEALKVTDIDQEQTMKFGDYIMAKWQAVYRK